MWNGVSEYVRTSRIGEFLGSSITLDNIVRITLTGLAAVGAVLLTGGGIATTVGITVSVIGVSEAYDFWQMHQKRALLHRRERALLRRENPAFRTGMIKIGLFTTTGLCVFGYIYSSFAESPNVVGSCVFVGSATVLIPMGRMLFNSNIRRAIRALDQEILRRIQEGRIDTLDRAELANIDLPAIHLIELMQRPEPAALIARATAAERQVRTLTAELNRVRSELAAEQRLARDVCASVERLEAEHVQQITDLNREHARAIAGLQTTHADQIKQLELKHSQEISKLQGDHTAAIDGLIQQHAQAIESSDRAHSAAIEQLKLTHSQEMDHLQSTHAEAIAALQATHADAKHQLELSHTQKISELQSSHATEISGLQSELAQNRLTIEQLTGQLKKQEEAYSALQKEHAEVTRQLQEFHPRGTPAPECAKMSEAALVVQRRTRYLSPAPLVEDEVHNDASGTRRSVATQTMTFE